MIQDVLESEEVDRLVCRLSYLQPVIKPQFVTMCTPILEVFPPGKNGHLGHFLLELATVTLCDGQIVERRVGIELIPGAHKSDISTPVFLEWEHVREVSLVNPRPLVDYAFSFEAAELQSNVGRVPHDHIRASRRPCRILKVLAHKTVTTTRVCSVNDSHLLLAVTSCVAGLWAEEPLLFQFISLQVFRTQ